MLRHYLKSLIICAIAFYAAYTFIPTISLGPDPRNILIVIGAIFVASFAIHPVFSLILLPVNFLTFGAVSLILNAALIFGFIKFLPGFSIAPYYFPGASIEGIVVPAQALTQMMAIVAVALIITVVQKILQVIFN